MDRLMLQRLGLTLALAAPMTVNAADGGDNVVLYYNGPAQANQDTQATENFVNFPEDIQKFCVTNNPNQQNICPPTTQFDVINPLNNKVVGSVHVWATSQVTSGTIPYETACFTEVIKYDLKDAWGQGTVYTLGNTNGTCGAFTDPNLVKPVDPSSQIVIVGGGRGDGSAGPDAAGVSHGIVGATGDFAYLKHGSYVDRVFVEFSPTFSINYYDGLYFTLTPPGTQD